MSARHPLSYEELLVRISNKTWDLYKGEDDPGLPPPAFLEVISLAIYESYQNVDSMLDKMMRSKLERLYNDLTDDG